MRVPCSYGIRAQFCTIFFLSRISEQKLAQRMVLLCAVPPFKRCIFVYTAVSAGFFAIMLRVVVVVICATYRLKIETFSPGEVCYLTVMSCAIEMMLCKYIPIVVSPLHKEQVVDICLVAREKCILIPVRKWSSRQFKLLFCGAAFFRMSCLLPSFEEKRESL